MLPTDQVVRLANEVLPKLSNCGTPTSTSTSTPILTSKNIKTKQLCRLWAGMGHIYLVTISSYNNHLPTNNNNNNSNNDSGNIQFVIKHVTPPSSKRQSFGDHRKAQSYQVEANFYKHLEKGRPLSPLLDVLVLPTPYLVEYGPAEGEITIVMSYLQSASSSSGGGGGSGGWYDYNSNGDISKHTISWLAKFHATFWGTETIDSIVETVGLQSNGGYWHLDTRPDEHASMSQRGWEGRLKRAAKAIDACIKRDDIMQCLIHGDPKDANVMTISSSSSSSSSSGGGGGSVAMYDFQYCGKGPPTRDLAYFLCSSCEEDEEEELVEQYFTELVGLLEEKKKKSSSTNFKIPSREHFQQSLELAYADYCRFMAGWGYWGFNIQGRVKRFLDNLDGGKDLGSEEAYDDAIREKLW